MKIPTEPAVELPQSPSEAFALGWRMAHADTRLDTAMKLIRDNKSVMHFDREVTQADHDIFREARKWG